MTKLLLQPNVYITHPATLAIQETLIRATADKFRSVYPPQNAGRVNAWLGARTTLSLLYFAKVAQFCKGEERRALLFPQNHRRFYSISNNQACQIPMQTR